MIFDSGICPDLIQFVFWLVDGFSPRLCFFSCCQIGKHPTPTSHGSSVGGFVILKQTEKIQDWKSLNQLCMCGPPVIILWSKESLLFHQVSFHLKRWICLSCSLNGSRLKIVRDKSLRPKSYLRHGTCPRESLKMFDIISHLLSLFAIAWISDWDCGQNGYDSRLSKLWHTCAPRHTHTSFHSGHALATELCWCIRGLRTRERKHQGLVPAIQCLLRMNGSWNERGPSETLHCVPIHMRVPSLHVLLRMVGRSCLKPQSCLDLFNINAAQMMIAMLLPSQGSSAATHVKLNTLEGFAWLNNAQHIRALAKEWQDDTARSALGKRASLASAKYFWTIRVASSERNERNEKGERKCGCPDEGGSVKDFSLIEKCVVMIWMYHCNHIYLESS